MCLGMQSTQHKKQNSLRAPPSSSTGASKIASPSTFCLIMDATAAPKTKNKNTRRTFGSKRIAKQSLAKSRAKFEERKGHSATAACAASNTERRGERRGGRVAAERLLGVAVASLSSGAQPIGCSGVLWDMFGCGPLLRHGLLLLLLQLCSESSRAGMCGALPKTHKAGLSFFLGEWGPVFGI